MVYLSRIGCGRLRIYQSAWPISKSGRASGIALFGARLVGLDLFPRGLALETQRGDRAGHQALEADRLATFLAFVDIAAIEAPQGVLDLAEQERLAIGQPQLGRIQLLLG